MKVTVVAEAPVAVKADILALPTFEGEKPDKDFVDIDRRLNGLLKTTRHAEKFEGAEDTALTLHTHGRVGAARVLLLGGGKRAEIDVARARMLAARAVQAAAAVRAGRLALRVPVGVDVALLARAFTEGALVAAYRFLRYKSEKAEPNSVEEVVLLVDGGAQGRDAARAGLAEGLANAGAVNLARDLINEPAMGLSPVDFAEHAAKVAKKGGLDIKVLDPKAMKKEQMNLLLAVGQGSDREPRFVHLTYKPKRRGKEVPTHVYVGKGITFDSGGLSLKQPKSMVGMHYDMSGAAAVLGAMQVLAELEPPVVVHGLCALAENMPSGHAYRPSDIIRGRNGKSVEIISTDAEGRLVLADALAYGADLKPDRMLDLATLTGACLVALGSYTAAVMSNDDDVRDEVLAAARRAGEDVWPLPLTKRLKEALRSDHADIKNSGDSYGGAIAGGLFLREFVGSARWAHLDIAGPAAAEKDTPLHQRGATGFGVMTLVEFARGAAAAGAARK
ncbi:MAG TPA: leucyl aminopeptidase [Myxococcota bacterium]|jgi:leucyl aminopeptidase|nr:leucyl aminopeptidase [Myxococcota bacterium]